MVYRAKRNFLKSKARDHWKSICKDLPVLFCLNNKSSKAYYGMATFNNKKDIKFFKDRKSVV